MKKEDLKYILELLRWGTTHWPGRSECLNRNRRQKKVGTYQNGNPKLIWEHPCEECGQWFDQKDNALQVDHIEEVGPYKGDIHDYAERMYCPQSNLQALCVPCHARKTSKFNATLTYARKNKKRDSRLD